MMDRDPRLVIVEMAQRIERLEAICVLLCVEAAQGQGQRADPFRTFVEAWKAEHDDEPSALSAHSQMSALDN